MRGAKALGFSLREVRDLRSIQEERRPSQPLATLFLLSRFRKLPEPVVILLAGVVGLLVDPA